VLTVDSYGSGERAPLASDEYETVELGPIRQALLAWQRWRRTRPFWGGLLIILGGAEMLLSEQAPLPIVIHVGVQGLAGYLVPIVLVLCGVLLWLSPLQQTFYSVLAVVLALGSWVTSNLGGFFVGLMLGVIGGALAFAWQRGEGPVPGLPEAVGGPEKTPSEGLGLILGDEALGGPDDDDERAAGEPRPAPDGEPLPQEDGEPLPQGDGELLPQGNGGESGGSLRAGGVIMAISAMPLMLMFLAQTTSPSLSPSPGKHHTERRAVPERAADHRGPQPTQHPSQTDQAGQKTGRFRPRPARCSRGVPRRIADIREPVALAPAAIASRALSVSMRIRPRRPAE
jgi:hypothetical protein